MTMIDYADPTPIRAAFRRDRWSRPLVVPANGGKAKGYTRTSTAAKAIEDTFGLEQWARRNVAFGLAHDPSLVARIIALGGTPHTWSADDKTAATKICEDAANIAQAHKGADIGTAVHRLVERWLLGEDVNAGPWQPDLDAFADVWAQMGWTINTDHVECRLVCDELEMAGTADMIVNTGAGHAIADLKTGRTVTFGGLGYAAQLAAYAHGDLYDPDTDTRLPTPDIDTTTGFVVHLPAGEGRCQVYAVDLERGYGAAKLANEVRAVRKASRKWMTLMDTPTPQPSTNPTPTLGEIHDAWAKPDEGGPADDAAVEVLKARYEALEVPPMFRGLTVAAQQAGVPFHLKEARTVRRFELVRGLVLLAEAGGLDDDTVRILVSTAMDSDVAQWPTITAGHALGALTATQAATFAGLCSTLAEGRGVVLFDDATKFGRLVA